MTVTSIHKGKGKTFDGKRYTPAYACTTRKEAIAMANRARKNYQQNARVAKVEGEYIVYVN